MNAISGLLRVNWPGNGDNPTPEKANNSTSSTSSISNGAGTVDNRETKQPAPELQKINGTFSLDNQQELSIKEKLDLMILQNEERNVREHERSHLRAARDLAVSGPAFQYKRGPDGKKYAIHGEVNIDSTGVSGDTQATIEKALKIQRAAMAPADPSPKDLQAAARARIMESKAYRKLARENQHQAGENQENLTPAIDAYQNVMANQKNLYEILELFA